VIVPLKIPVSTPVSVRVAVALAAPLVVDVALETTTSAVIESKFASASVTVIKRVSTEAVPLIVEVEFAVFEMSRMETMVEVELTVSVTET